ncbi:MAG: tetraacyldisaccharide 4'-kinase [Gemmatimonadota bacterium]
MIGPFARARRALHRAGLLRPGSLPRPVVSVGNLTVGGAGKTPHVQFLARWLCARGVKVAILSRGYRRGTRGVVWASGEPPAPADSVGDEPALLARTLPGVPVVVGESRLEAGREALRRREVDAFLLDDGFQHLSLRRDADLLLVDGTRGLGNGRTLPFGPLREPPDHARFADALVVTRCRDASQGEGIAARLAFPAGRPVAATRFVPRCLVDGDGTETALPPPGGEVAAFAGLADNAQFEATLRACGFRPKRFLAFGDHHRYGPRDVRRIAAASGGMPVLTTEKDLVRLPGGLPFRVNAVRIDVEFLSGWEALSRLVLDRIGKGPAG